MNEGGAALSLTYIASEDVIPGYGSGMSSAKAALESDQRWRGRPVPSTSIRVPLSSPRGPPQVPGRLRY